MVSIKKMKQNEIELILMKEQLKVSRDDIHEIKSYHIPAIYQKFEEMKGDVLKQHEKTNEKIDDVKKDVLDMRLKIAYWVGGITVVGWIINLYIQFIKWN